MEDGTALEAKYNNEGPGNYHGYPLQETDPFVDVLKKFWEQN